MKAFKVTAIWDDEAGVWSVAESDIPGLSTWAATIPYLKKKILELAPELIELNAHLLRDGDPRKAPISLVAHYEKTLRTAL